MWGCFCLPVGVVFRLARQQGETGSASSKLKASKLAACSCDAQPTAMLERSEHILVQHEVERHHRQDVRDATWVVWDQQDIGMRRQL